MEHHAFNADEIAERLEAEGHQMTRTRRKIVDWVASQPASFTANQLIEAMDGVGRATVFRTLDLLVRQGYLNRIHSLPDCATYTRCDGGHHHHLVCVLCNRVFRIADLTIERKLHTIADREHFRVSGHHLEVFGECAACQRSPQSRNTEAVRA